MSAESAAADDHRPERHAALVDDLAERIRQRIMSGEFPIGTQLRQAALASEFKVSRTPVREALRQLQAGGLITVVPNRGAIVRVPAPWEVRDAYEVRAELEGLAAERAATRISPADLARITAANETMRKAAGRKQPERVSAGQLPTTTVANDTFHVLILDAAGNDRLTQAIQQINESFPRNVLWQVLVENPSLRGVNVDEHAAIIAALEAGDRAEARRTMRRHVLTAGEHLARWYEQRSTTVFRG
jgi:DNA-binding GntR family transcriptional regulator